MKRINNSNFELLEDIIKTMDFNYNQDEYQKLDEIKGFWAEVVGEKISKFSKVYDISSDNCITVVCSDSFVVNELYFEKKRLLQCMNEKAEKMGIKIEDIRFDYKRWKERNNE